MSPKYISFITLSFFFSVLICMVLEGIYFSAAENSIFNDLSRPIVTLKVGGLVPIPAFNIYFFRGLAKITTFNYSFYEGGFTILRYFWTFMLVPALVWGVAQVFAPVFANLLRLFR